jgi:hypothetical protein
MSAAPGWRTAVDGKPCTGCSPGTSGCSGSLSR